MNKSSRHTVLEPETRQPFQTLISVVSGWPRHTLQGFKYSGSDEWGLEIQVRHPNRVVPSKGGLYAVAVSSSLMHFVFWQPSEPKKRLFVFLEESFLTHGTVTITWPEKRLGRTWGWEPTTRTLHAHIQENSELQPAADEVENLLQLALTDKNTQTWKMHWKDHAVHAAGLALSERHRAGQFDEAYMNDWKLYDEAVSKQRKGWSDVAPDVEYFLLSACPDRLQPVTE